MITVSGVFRYLSTSATTVAGTPVTVTSMGTYGVVAQGEANVVFIYQDGVAQQSWTVQDSAGNTYEPNAVATDGALYTIWCFTAPNANAMTTSSTLKVTPSVSGNSFAVYTVVLRGLGSADRVTPIVTSGSGTTWQATVGPYNPANAIGIVSVMSAVGGTALPSGWTNPQGYVDTAHSFLLTAVNAGRSVRQTISAALNSPGSAWVTVGWVVSQPSQFANVMVLGAGPDANQMIQVDTTQFPVTFNITGNPPKRPVVLQCFPKPSLGTWETVGWLDIPPYWGPSGLQEIGVPWPPPLPSPDPSTYS